LIVWSNKTPNEKSFFILLTATACSRLQAWPTTPFNPTNNQLVLPTNPVIFGTFNGWFTNQIMLTTTNPALIAFAKVPSSGGFRVNNGYLGNTNYPEAQLPNMAMLMNPQIDGDNHPRGQTNSLGLTPKFLKFWWSYCADTTPNNTFPSYDNVFAIKVDLSGNGNSYCQAYNDFSVLRDLRVDRDGYFGRNLFVTNGNISGNAAGLIVYPQFDNTNIVQRSHNIFLSYRGGIDGGYYRYQLPGTLVSSGHTPNTDLGGPYVQTYFAAGQR
jgi:hypothetical protein